MTLSLNTNAAAGDPGVNTAAPAADNVTKIDTTVAEQQAAVERSGVPQRPENVPEKFWKDGKVDYDSILKSYNELQTKLSTGQTAAPTDQTAAPTNQTAAPTNQTEAPHNQIDLLPFTQEFETNGALSEDSYAKLQSMGFPKDIVDGYIEGQVAARTLYANQLIEQVGGRDTYVEMCKAAAAAWSPAEIAEFEKAVGGNPQQINAAVNKLSTWYTQQFGGQGNFIAGDTAAAMGGEAYESMEQLRADLAKPEYATDPAFRQKVEKKLELHLRRTGRL